MPSNSDIRVQQIIFNPAILCNCPTDVKVTLINVGNAPPASTSADQKFEVCLQSPAFRAETGTIYRQRVLGGEGPRQLLPGQTLTVTFRNVVFLHAGRQQVTACADCQGVYPQAGPPQYEIGNDLHTKPCLQVDVVVIPVAWLQVDQVEIDLEDSLGNRNRNVGQLCPGSTFVAIATVNNRGCAAAQNFTAQLTILDQNGNVLDTINQVVPIVNPLAPVQVEFRGTVPAPNAAGAAYTFRVCVDVTNQVRPQCSRQLLCLATAPIPVVQQGGPGPTVTLIVNSASSAPIVPGQEILISWRIQNDCSDLGNITARVILQATGDLLYDSAATRGPIPVPPLGSGGQPIAFIPRPAVPNVAAALYRVGAKVLHIEVTGTGRDPGPYGADAPLTISGENFASWWSWDLTGSDLHWKEPYNVGGTLTNSSLGGATMNVMSVTFREFDDDAAPRVPTGHVFAVPPPFGSLAPAASGGFVWPNVIQEWVWLTASGPVFGLPWSINGPLQRDFGYEADIQLTDEFGNVYNPLVRLDPPVTVIRGKIAAATAALAFQAAAVAAAITGAGLVSNPFTLAIGIGFLVAAGIAEAVAIIAVVTALDPPVPDFSYREAVTVEPQPLPEALEELPADLAPVRSVLELLNRIVAAIDALGRIQRKLLGARIDNHAEGLRIQVGGYRGAESLLRMAAAHLPAAVAEAVGALKASKALPSEAIVRETLDAWRRDGLPASVRDPWVRARLSEDALAQLEAAIRSPDWSSEIPSFEMSLQKFSDTLVRVARQVEAETPTILGGLEEIAPP